MRKEDALVWEYVKDDTSYEGKDIAVFKLDNTKSPLKFSEKDSGINQKLHSISYQHCARKSSDDIFPKNDEYFDLIECEAFVELERGNYFQCKMDAVLKKGSSGSVLLDGDKVVGILHGGMPGKLICDFIKISVIKRLIYECESQL